MANFIGFILLAALCALIACTYVIVTTKRIKTKVTRELKYSRIMARAAVLERHYYEKELSDSFDSFPAIRKYVSQSKYMLDNGIPFYQEPNLIKLSKKDKTFRRLLSELGQAPGDIRKLTFMQAKLISDIVEAKNPILSKLESLKKNTQIRILLHLLNLLTKMEKVSDNRRINDLELDNKVMTQSHVIQSTACSDGC